MKTKILRCVFGGLLSVALFIACDSDKEMEKAEDHEVVMNTTTPETYTVPVNKDTMRKDSIGHPFPDTIRTPPRK